MNTALDTAIVDAGTSEATYLAKLANVANIQTAIETATAPLAPAQSDLQQSVVDFNGKLQALSAAALAAVVPTGGSTDQ